MSCYFPLHAFKDKSEDTQKTKITFNRNSSWRGERLELSCGQCIGCRLEKARSWAVRCMHEASLHSKNSFITLTYDNRHVPQNGSLRLRDFQLFMKRLRKLSKEKIRFFQCGEYGEQKKRPHHHALLFNFDFEDKTPFSKGKGYKIYTSHTLSRLWPHGFTTTGDVSFESAGYVARYSMKKVTGKHAKEYYGVLKPEQATMSRRPGIGKKWFDKYRGDVYPHDRVIVNGVHSRPPRYYDDLLGKSDPAELARLKIEREKNEKYVQMDIGGVLKRISDSCDIRLIEKEKTKKGEVSLLRRHKGWTI